MLKSKKNVQRLYTETYKIINYKMSCKDNENRLVP